MSTFPPAEDSATSLLERRWFAAERAVSEVEAECEALANVLDLARSAWRGARTRLYRLEALREALGDELAVLDGREERAAVTSRRSAA